VSEEASVRNISHEKLNHHEELVNLLVESRGEFGRRSASNGLLQIGMRFGIVELHRLDPSKIVVISCELVVASRRREGCLRDKLVCLIVEIVGDIVSKQAIDERGFSFVIVTKGRSPLCGKEKPREWINFLPNSETRN